MSLRKILSCSLFCLSLLQAPHALAQSSRAGASPEHAPVLHPIRPYDGKSIINQRMGENLCVLTFDDGPSAYTPRLLEILDQHGVPATFFMLGINAASHPDIVRMVVEQGHEVASHSYSHPNFKQLKPAKRMEELTRTNNLLRSLGADPVLFRPPYGAMDPQLVQMAAELGMRVVTWSHDSEDWRARPSDYTKIPSYYRGLSPAHMRGVYLFHDIHKTTVDDIPRAIRQMRAGGCDRFVTLSDYMNELFLDPEPPLLMTLKRERPTAKKSAGHAARAVRGIKATREESLLVGTAHAATPDFRMTTSDHVIAASLPAESLPTQSRPVSRPEILTTYANAPWPGFARDEIRLLTESEKARYASGRKAREQKPVQHVAATDVPQAMASPLFRTGQRLEADKPSAGFFRQSIGQASR